TGMLARVVVYVPESPCNRFPSSAPKNWKPRLIAPCASGCKGWWSSLPAHLSATSTNRRSGLEGRPADDQSFHSLSNSGSADGVRARFDRPIQAGGDLH